MAVSLWWDFREIGTDVANNTSTVKLDIYVTCTGSSHYEYDQWGTVWWGTEHSTDAYKLYSNTDNHVHSETQTITHNPDGTGSTTFACAIPTTSAGGTKYSGDVTLTLTTLPRASTINSFNGTDITGNFNATYTTKTSGYKHKLRISIPGVIAIQTFDNYSSGSNVTFSNSALQTLQNYMANKNSITLGGVIETWNGNTKIGESEELMHTCYWYRGRIKVNGTWRKATPYIKVSGAWKEAIPFVKSSGTWKQGI